jgi:2'-5' RNA ligase
VSGSEQRLFIALALPDEIKRSLARLSENLQKGIRFTPCRLSWVSAETMHLTLRFLGAIDRSRIEGLSAELRAIAARHGPIRMRARQLEVIPHWRRPRVLWVGVHGGGALEALHGEIEAMAARGGIERSDAPFHPHLTLARFKSSRAIAAARGVVEAHRGFRTEDFEIGAVTLFRSELRPEGARHEALERARLEKSPGRG